MLTPTANFVCLLVYRLGKNCPIVFCIVRVQNFWGRVGETLAKIDSTIVFDDASKIFGVEKTPELWT